MACAQASLHADLHRLHACPARLVDATRAHLALSDDVAVDVHAQLRTMACVEAMTAKSPSADLIGLLTGDLLPGWYDDWLVIERELLRSRRLHALETLARRWGREGCFASAIQACLTVLASDPLRETAHRALIVERSKSICAAQLVRIVCQHRMATLLPATAITTRRVATFLAIVGLAAQRSSQTTQTATSGRSGSNSMTEFPASRGPTQSGDKLCVQELGHGIGLDHDPGSLHGV